MNLDMDFSGPASETFDLFLYFGYLLPSTLSSLPYALILTFVATAFFLALVCRNLFVVSKKNPKKSYIDNISLGIASVINLVLLFFVSPLPGVFVLTLMLGAFWPMMAASIIVLVAGAFYTAVSMRKRGLSKSIQGLGGKLAQGVLKAEGIILLILVVLTLVALFVIRANMMVS